MPTRSIVGLVASLLLLLPASASAVNVNVNMPTGTFTPGTTLTLTTPSGTQTQTVPPDGQVTFTDVPAGSATLIHSGPGTQTLTRRVNVADGAPPVTLFGRPWSPASMTAPPPGMITGGPYYSIMRFDDMQKTGETLFDRVDDGRVFPVRRLGSVLRSDNLIEDHAVTVETAGMYFAIGLPTCCLDQNPYFSVTHALSVHFGYARMLLDVTSARSNRDDAFEASGDGVYGGLDYTVSIVPRRSERHPLLSRFGLRTSVLYLQGSTGASLHPRQANGLDGFNQALDKNQEGDLNFSSWSFSSDLLFRVCECLYLFAGIKARWMDIDANIRTPTRGPVGAVTRDLRMDFTDHDLVGRAGAMFMLASLSRMIGMPLMGGVEVEVGPNGWGGFINLGVGLDLFRMFRSPNPA